MFYNGCKINTYHRITIQIFICFTTYFTIRLLIVTLHNKISIKIMVMPKANNRDIHIFV